MKNTMPNVLRETIFFTILSVATVAQGADFEVHPSITVSQEYNDNLYETPTNRITDYITRALPGLTAKYTAPALSGDLNYVFDYRHYARKTRDDETTHVLNANGHLTAVDNVMFLDVSDVYQRVSLDVTRDVTRESLFVNQSDINVATVSPYFTFHPTARIVLKPGYRFIDTRYFRSYGGSFGIDKTDHVAFLNMKYELMNRWSLTADYSFTRELSAIDNLNLHQALGGLRYEYAEKSFIFAQAGNTWITHDNGQNSSSFLWSAGFLHVFDTGTASITTGVRYEEDPLHNIQLVKENFVNASLEKRFQRGTLSFSPYYSEYVLTGTDTLQTRKYGAITQGDYEITSDLRGRLAFTAEKYEQPLLGSYTVRYQVDSGLSYLLAKELTLTLTYIYVDYSSPGIATDNRYVNRAMVEIKKTF